MEQLENKMATLEITKVATEALIEEFIDNLGLYETKYKLLSQESEHLKLQRLKD